MPINIGINGFGRIGKCVFLQSIEDENIKVKAINAVNLDINEIEDYLRYDSCHKLNLKNLDFNIIDNSTFSINNNRVHLFSSRDPEQLDWEKYNCEYLIEATGSFLTTEKCKNHQVKKVIISAPPKDSTPSFVFGANHENYNGENIISASSCTTNSLAPFLNLVLQKYHVKSCLFTTIHAATSSQYTVDVFKKSARTKRSVFNNIIPHTTGASKSITKIFPQLEEKITGNSVRIPVSNCSLLDVTLTLEEEISLQNFKELFLYSNRLGEVFSLNEKDLVSSDFMTTTTPCILDLKASLQLGKNTFKLMIWYDNEWSYSSQILRLVNYISSLN